MAAGGVTLGYLRYILGLDTVSFRKGMTDAERDLVLMQKRFEQVGSKMAGLGNKLTVGLTLPLAAFAAKGIKEAQETAQAMGQVNAALTSMGPVAGRTSEQLEKAANAFEKSSLFEADEILSKVTANLLTFGNISGQAFDRAQQAAVNLSARLGQDLQSSAIQVGKALNDPIKGVTALQRVGVSFTAAQKKQIKALVDGGHAAQAQALILNELERQFGGAAQAAQDTDPWNKATDAFKQMAETVGTALLPIIPPLTDAIASIANAFSSLSPETQKWLVIAAGGVAVLGPLLSVLGNIVLVVSSLGPVVLTLTKAWTALQVAFAAVRVAALATLPALAPFLVPLGAIAVAVGAVYLAWKNWDKITAIVGRMVSGVKTHLATLRTILAAVAHPIDTVSNAFKALYDKVVGHSYIPDMVDEIGAQLERLDAVLVQPVTKAASKAAEAFRDLQQSTKTLLDRLFPEAAALNTFRSEMKILDQAMKAHIITVDQYAAALQRLQTEGLSDEPISVATEGSGSLVPSDDTIIAGMQDVLGNLPQIIDRTKQWQAVVGQVAQDLADIGGDFLSRLVQGSVKLKDLWKELAVYAIQFLTSPNSPFMSLFGGARANGGPVLANRPYLVGERGPEIFMPSGAGRIVSNEDSQGMMSGGRDVTFNVYANDADSFRRSERQINRDLRRRLA